MMFSSSIVTASKVSKLLTSLMLFMFKMVSRTPVVVSLMKSVVIITPPRMRRQMKVTREVTSSRWVG